MMNGSTNGAIRTAKLFMVDGTTYTISEEEGRSIAKEMQSMDPPSIEFTQRKTKTGVFAMTVFKHAIVGIENFYADEFYEPEEEEEEEAERL